LFGAGMMLHFHVKSLEHAKPKEGSLYFIDQAVPCILHLENGTLIKIITAVLINGLVNAQA